MEIFANRRARLRQLIDDECGGNQAEFSRRTGIKSPQINRWLSITTTDKRNIREESARQIEKAIGLPSGWLDQSSTDSVYQTKEPVEPRKRVEQSLAPYTLSEAAGRIRPSKPSLSIMELEPEEVSLIAAFRICDEKSRSLIRTKAVELSMKGLAVTITPKQTKPKAGMVIFGSAEQAGLEVIGDPAGLLEAVGLTSTNKQFKNQQTKPHKGKIAVSKLSFESTDKDAEKNEQKPVTIKVGSE